MGELVLIAGRDPFRHTGGAESYAVAHLRAAKLAGLTPHFFVTGRKREVIELDCGVLHRFVTPVPTERSLYAGLHRPWAVGAVVSFLRDRPGPHVLHAYGSWSDAALRASRRLAARGVDARAVATFFTTAEHEATGKYRGGLVASSLPLRLMLGFELAWVRRVNAPAQGRAYRSCTAVAVNYESVRALLEAAYGHRPDVRLLSYAAPTAFLSGTPPAQAPLDPMCRDDGGPPLIVSVSRHSARKGLDVLIRALAELRDDGVAFRACLLGTGMLLGAHRKLVRSLKLEHQVSLPGPVPDVMPYLRACDVYVLPSTEEGSGSVSVLEALQAGAAIVSSALDGMPEDLTHEQDALLVAPGSSAELCDALARLLKDERLRRELGAAARGVFERRFSPAVAARSLADFYSSLGLRSVQDRAQAPLQRVAENFSHRARFEALDERGEEALDHQPPGR